MPPVGVIKQIAASFRFHKKYSIRILQCQVQGASDCLACATANLDLVLSGNDISKIEFDKKLVRSFFVESLIKGRLFFLSLGVKHAGKLTFSQCSLYLKMKICHKPLNNILYRRTSIFDISFKTIFL